MGLVHKTYLLPSPTCKNLGAEYRDHPSETPLIIPRPLPETQTHLTTERLKTTLLLADRLLRTPDETTCRLSPVVSHRLVITKLTANLALNLESGLPPFNKRRRDAPTKSELHAFIAATSQSLFTPPAPEHPSLLLSTRCPSFYLDRLTQLRRYEFALTYGHYAQMLCQSMSIPPSLAEECFPSYFEQQIPDCSAFWKTVYDEMTTLRETFGDDWCDDVTPFTEEELNAHAGGEDLTPAEGIFKTALLSNGLSHPAGIVEATIRLIKRQQYGICQDVLCYVEGQDWDELKGTLECDLVGLHGFIWPGQRRVIPALRQIIEAVADRYFHRDAARPYDSGLWEVRGKAVTKAKEFEAARDRKAEREGDRDTEPWDEDMELVRAERRAVVEVALEKYCDVVSRGCEAWGGRVTYRRLRVDLGDEGVWGLVKGAGKLLRVGEDGGWQALDAGAWMCLLDDERGRLPSSSF